MFSCLHQRNRFSSSEARIFLSLFLTWKLQIVTVICLRADRLTNFHQKTRNTWTRNRFSSFFFVFEKEAGDVFVRADPSVKTISFDIARMKLKGKLWVGREIKTVCPTQTPMEIAKYFSPPRSRLGQQQKSDLEKRTNCHNVPPLFHVQERLSSRPPKVKK